MSTMRLKQRFKEIFRNRINNESRYIQFGTYIEHGGRSHSFTDKEGHAVEFPKELMPWQDYAQLMVDLKEKTVVGWKSEMGAMHIKLDVGCSAQYRLLNELEECFCLLKAWPPRGVVPCNTLEGNGYRYIEFDVLENGKIIGWPENPTFGEFISYGEFWAMEEDKAWIADQVDKKDTPEGDPDIRDIPYNCTVTAYKYGDEEVAIEEFNEFFAAMNFVREAANDPEVHEINIRTDEGWCRDFFREPYEECPEIDDDMFDKIEPWIEEAKVKYILREIMPDEIEQEAKEIDLMLGCSENYASEDEDPSLTDEDENDMSDFGQRDKYKSDVPGLDLQFSFSSLTDDIWEEDFHRHIHCDIYQDENKGYYGNCLGRPGERKKIGEVELVMLNWKRASKHISMDYLAGLGGSQVQDVVEMFFEGQELKEKWTQEFDLCDSKNILYVYGMELDAEHRGLHWGKYVLKSIMETFDGMFGIMVLDVYAQDVDYLDNDHKDVVVDEPDFKCEVVGKEDKQATIKLMKYYTSLGFKTYGNPLASPYFIDGRMWMNMGRENPGMDRVDIHVYWDY